MTTAREDFSGEGTASSRQPGAEHPAGPGGLREILARVERDLILAALQQSRGNKAKAARALGISQRLMGIRVQRLGIDWRGLRRRLPAEAQEA